MRDSKTEMDFIQETLKDHAAVIQILINKNNKIREKLGILGPAEKIAEQMKKMAISSPEVLTPAEKITKLRNFLRNKKVIRLKENYGGNLHKDETETELTLSNAPPAAPPSSRSEFLSKPVAEKSTAPLSNSFPLKPKKETTQGSSSTLAFLSKSETNPTVTPVSSLSFVSNSGVAVTAASLPSSLSFATKSTISTAASSPMFSFGPKQGKKLGIF